MNFKRIFAGSTFPALVAASVIRDKSSRPLSFLIIGRNITNEKQAERELQLLLWKGDPSHVRIAPAWRKIAAEGLRKA